MKLRQALELRQHQPTGPEHPFQATPGDTSVRPAAPPASRGAAKLLHFPQSSSDCAEWTAFDSQYRVFLSTCVRGALLAANLRFPQEDVEDLVQDLFTRLLEDDGRRLRAFRGRTDAELRSYLRKIAQRMVADFQRRCFAEKRGGSALSPRLGRGASENQSFLDRQPTPEERLLLREGCWQAVSCALPEGTKTARRSLELLRRSLIEGQTSREISEAWNGALKPSSIDSTVHRMRKRVAHSDLEFAALALCA